MLDHSLRGVLPHAARPRPELRVALAAGGLAVGFGVLVLLVRELDAPTALVLVLGAAAAMPLVLWPSLATLLVVFLLYTNIPVLLTYQGVPELIASASMLLLAVPLAHAVIVRREPLRFDVTLMLMLGFLASILASAVNAKSDNAAMGYVQTYVLEGLVLYWLLVNSVRSGPTLHRVIWTMIAGGALLGGLASYQEATGQYDQQFYGLAHRNVEYLELQALDPEDPAVAELIQNYDGARNRRAEGPMNEPNRFAQILLVVLPLTLYAYRSARSRGPRVCAAVAAVLIFGGMLFSDSRGALVALVLLAVLAAYMGWIRRSHLVVAGLLLVLAVPIVSPRYAARALSLVHVTALAQGPSSKEADGAIRGRATEMLAAVQAFLDHPVLGVGPGQYLHFYSLEYQQKNPRLKFRDIRKGRRAHSLYPEIAAELGVVGLGSFLAIFAVLAYRLNRARRRFQASQPELANLAAALVFSLLAFLITSAFLHLSYMRYLWLLVALASATLHVLDAAERTARTTRAPRTGRVVA